MYLSPALLRFSGAGPQGAEILRSETGAFDRELLGVVPREGGQEMGLLADANHETTVAVLLAISERILSNPRYH